MKKVILLTIVFSVVFSVHALAKADDVSVKVTQAQCTTDFWQGYLLFVTFIVALWLLLRGIRKHLERSL